MGDAQSKAAEFFEAMGQVVRDNMSDLTDAQGVPGTKLGLFELRALGSAYDRFQQDCVPQLSAGHTCTTVFNTGGGKKIDVQLDAVKGLEIGITAPADEGGQTRKLSYRPPVRKI